MFHSLNRGVAIACAATLVCRASAGSGIADATADAALGQVSLTANQANAPAGVVNAAGMSLSNAVGLAIGPNGRVYLGDADNNRVLSWPSAASFTTGQAADLVIGQPDFSTNAPNSGGLSASSLWLPQGLCVDAAGALWVCDAYNSRVLRFDDPATTDRVADLVIGQPNFTSGLPNLGGGFRDQGVATADSILFPGGVVVRWPDVYVADSGNSRILHYTAPNANKPTADRVWGQYGDFRQRAKNNDGNGLDSCCPTADTLFNPIGITLDAAGDLWVADWMNHRVLRFADPLGSGDTTADLVFGQPDFVSSAPDAGGMTSGLHLPLGIAFDARGRLWIADSGNNRCVALRPPFNTGTTVYRVLGQLNNVFGQSANHGLGPFVCDADSLFGPSAIAFDAMGNALVADVNNSRLLRFAQLAPTPLRPAPAALQWTATVP